MFHNPCKIYFSITEISSFLFVFIHSSHNVGLTPQTFIFELWLQIQPRPYCINICLIGAPRYNLLGEGIYYASKVKSKPLFVTEYHRKHKHQKKATESKALKNKHAMRMTYLIEVEQTTVLSKADKNHQ